MMRGFDLFCGIPFFIVYGIWETKRGVEIIFFNKDSYNAAISLHLFLVELILGEGKRKVYEDKLIASALYMRLRGYYSLIGGPVIIIVFIIVLFLELKY